MNCVIEMKDYVVLKIQRDWKCFSIKIKGRLGVASLNMFLNSGCKTNSENVDERIYAKVF